MVFQPSPAWGSADSLVSLWRRAGGLKNKTEAWPCRRRPSRAGTTPPWFGSETSSVVLVLSPNPEGWCRFNTSWSAGRMNGE
eukprot:7084291-Alexandrium_andersonii.AAC.1